MPELPDLTSGVKNLQAFQAFTSENDSPATLIISPYLTCFHSIS